MLWLVSRILTAFAGLRGIVNTYLAASQQNAQLSPIHSFLDTFHSIIFAHIAYTELISRHAKVEILLRSAWWDIPSRSFTSEMTTLVLAGVWRSVFTQIDILSRLNRLRCCLYAPYGTLSTPDSDVANKATRLALIWRSPCMFSLGPSHVQI